MGQTYRGRGAAAGIAVGPAFVWRTEPIKSPVKVSAGSREEETARLDAAKQAVEKELAELRSRTAQDVGEEEAAIFSAQLLILSDPAFIGAAKERIGLGSRAEEAIQQVTKEQAALLAALDDEYLSQRAADVRDVGERVLAYLQGRQHHLPRLEFPSIIIAHDLTPSETVRLPKERLLGLVTEVGGYTSHVAIMARALGIPVVVGIDGVVEKVESGQTVAIDGTTGEVVIQPPSTELARWRQRQEQMHSEQRRRQALMGQPAVTVDGHRVTLLANIGSPADVSKALEMGAQGSGLFRTEFLYMDRQQLPDEEEQFEAYRQVVAQFAPQPVVIRTLDVGGDKDLPYLGLVKEANPFLGWRGLRYSLASPDILRTQLRAILRAAAAGDVAIMFPLVVSVEEIRRAKEQVGLAQKELDERNLPRGEVKIGIMVETPAAAVLADQLAHEVDFFSIGSNDLTQYTLAADRHNEKVADIFDSYHPAVLRLIDMTIAAGSKAGIDVSLCGELAGDSLATPLLLGLGLRKFSAAAPSLPAVKEKICTWSAKDALSLAQKALQLSSAKEVRALLLG